MKHKRLLSVFLAVFILSLSITSSYTTAYASEHGGGGGNVYDYIYGEDGWKTDDDGVVRPILGDELNPVTSKFMNFLCLYSSIIGKAGAVSGLSDEMLNTFDTIRKSGKLANWVNNNISDINLKDGVLKIGKNALSNWRDVFRNNCYDMGSYLLLTSNMSRDYALDKAVSNSYSSAELQVVQAFLDNYGDCYFYGVRSNYIDRMVGINTSISPQFIIWDGYRSSNEKRFYTIKNSQLSSCEFRVFDRTGHSEYGTALYSSWNYSYHGEPLKVFSSTVSAKMYYGILNSDTTLNVYQYNNYSPTDISINMNTYNNTDYTTINNNIYQEINNEKNTYIENNTTISEDELQLIIDKTIKKYLELDVDIDTGGGSGGDNTGGGSGDDSGGGDFDDSTIVEWLKKIYDTLTTSDTRLELMNDILVNTQGFIKSLGEDVKEIVTSLTHISDTLDELLDISDDSGGNSIFDLIKKWFLKQLDNFNDLLNNIVGTLVGNLLKDLVDFFVGEDGLSDAVLSPAKALASSAQSKFPTSIPWDVIAIVKVMSAEPETPKFEIPFVIERWNVNYTIKIDFSKYEKVADLSRNMLTITFLLFLTIQTRNLYGSLSKN